jgi:hypothetical protein
MKYLKIVAATLFLYAIAYSIFISAEYNECEKPYIEKCVSSHYEKKRMWIDVGDRHTLRIINKKICDEYRSFKNACYKEKH